MAVLLVLLLLHAYHCADVAVMTQRPLVVKFTSRSAQLSWAPVYSQTVSPARTYLIQKRRHDPDGPWDVQNEIHVSDNRTTYNVTGLRPFTAYSFRVISVNSAGRSSPSQPSYPIITGREVPSGRPVVIRTSTLGPASIEVVWRPPDAAEMNGEFIGHLISFRRRNESTADWTRIDLPGNINSSISHVIDELLPFTDYLIRIQVRNMMGLGPYTVVRANTDEGVPEKPEDLSVGAVGSSWVDLTWRAPERPNGVIVGYYLYYQFILDGENFTDSRVVSDARATMKFNLTELEPNTEYKAWLFAKSGRHEGRPSDRVQFRTDVAGPAAPAVLNVSCVQDTSVQVHWRPAGLRRDPVDLYYVRYQRVEPVTLQQAPPPYTEVRVPAPNDIKQLTLRLDNLTLDTSYDVQVSGAVFSRLNSSVIRRGPLSGSHRVRLQHDCEILQQMHLLNAQRPVWQLSSGMMAGVICASVAVLLTLMALIIWRRYFQATYNYLAPENKKRLSMVCSDWEADTFEGDGAPIAVQAFPKHVATLNENGGVGFSKEFEDIQLSSAADKYTSELSQRSENKAKNRYLNVLAYDHSRVTLECPASPGRDCYINANFIDGYQHPRAYIATQGPLPETYNSFWSMVWQHNVSVIVVITNIIEAGRRKCDQYWPDAGKCVYGAVDVTYLGEDVMATYTIRRFNVGLVKVKRPSDGVDMDRIVYQYHYTCWPDSGIPHCRLPILSFVRKSSAANSDCHGPIIVHCSAGVGRTGTYIVLDAMLKMIRTTGTLNVYGFLKYIRTQRNFLVQTEEQYVFLHWALSDAVQMGETDIHSSFLARYLHNLRTSQHDVYPWYSLATQYRLITTGGLADTDAASARHPSNLCKNRCQDLVPAESSRVIISPRAGVECSDYINASWIVGFSHLKEFIITQHPLADTMADFWQMVWEHDVPVVVLLSPSSNENYTEFWPVENAYIECERFRVRFMEKTASGPCFIHEFLLTSHLDGTELSLRLVQCPDWPHGCVPLSRCLEAVETVRRCRQRQPAGPCVLVDRAGGLEASLFSCLSSLARQLEYEAHADVFQYARLCHQRRPGVWARPEDLLLLYRAVETLVVSSDSPRQLQLPAVSISQQPDVTYTQHHMPKPILKKPGTLRRDRCAAASSQMRIPPDGMESCVLDICQT